MQTRKIATSDDVERPSYQCHNLDAEALLRLADLLVDDVFAMSDEEILAEGAGDPDAEAEDAKVREAIARALRRHGYPAPASQAGRTADAARPVSDVLPRPTVS